MEKRTKRILSLLAVPVILVVVLSGVATAGVVQNINKGTSYPTIQSAINDADPGNEIDVTSGVYQENIDITKDHLTLRGIDTVTGKPVIDGKGNGSTITINSDNITVTGFNVANASTGWPGSSWPEAGIYLTVAATNSTIEDNTFSGNRFGVYSVSSGNIIKNNNASSNWQAGILLDFDGNNNLVTGNTLTNNSNGIDVYYGSYNTLSANNVSGNTNGGIGIYYANNNTVIDNEVSNNLNAGISLGNSYYNLIYHNNLKGNLQNGYDAGLNDFWDNNLEGNYWSDYTGPDTDGNGIIDNPYVIPGAGAEDRYPLTKPISHIPGKPSGLGQFRSDGVTRITAGDKTTDRTIIFKATANSLGSGNVKLQLELRRTDEYGGGFDENQPGIKESELVPSGTEVAFSVSDLIDANYHWRTRAVDVNGNKGDWEEFKDEKYPSVLTDFIVSEYNHWIAVVPVKLGQDAKSSISDDPVKVDQAIDARANDVKAYYYQQSYQQEKLKAEVLYKWSDNSEVKLDKTYDEYKIYADDPRSLIVEEVVLSIGKDKLIPYDAIVVVAAGQDFTPGGCKINSRYPDIMGYCGSKSYAIFPDQSMSNVWVHEVGHAVFDFLDKYPGVAHGGEIGFWGIIGSGSEFHGVDPLSPLDPISKHDADWIADIWMSDVWKNNHQIGLGKYPISLINDKGIYFLDPDTGPYDYIIEGRSPPDNGFSDSWCESNSCEAATKDPLKEGKGVLLYEYKKDAPIEGTAYKTDKIRSVPNHDPTIEDDTEVQNTVTLIPDTLSNTFDDHPTDTRFYVTEENGQLYLEISKLSTANKNIIIMGDYILPYSYGPNAYNFTQNIPDIDLKVFNSAGQMVGMNYTSGMYEMGINGVNTSGNFYGGMEWIAYPDSMADVYAVLDATPLKKWAEEVNVTLPSNIAVPMYLVQYDSNGNRTETVPVNITIDTANSVRVVQTSELLPDTTPPTIIIILQPINDDGSSVIKRGSVKPIKALVKDANGNNITTASAKINITWVNGTVLGTDVEDFSLGTANTDGVMRLTSEGIYIYHWGTTKDMKLGTYKIRIELDDGTVKEVLVGLRK